MQATLSSSSPSQASVPALSSHAASADKVNPQLSYAPILAGFGHLSNVLYDQDPAAAIKYAGYGFGAAWVAQFIGHGKVRPP